MTASNEAKRCEYCWKVRMGWGEKFHNDGCPDPLFLARGNTLDFEIADLKRRMSEWERGYNYGFNDNHIEPWRYRHFSSTFLMGYRVGKAEIDRLVDEAAQSR